MLNEIFNVSVIIPVYNAENFIVRAVESVVEIAEAFEVLLIEDGSQDNSLKICNQLAEKYNKVNVFRHRGGCNMGVASSRNLGIINASCNYVAFLDADDYYLPNRFEYDKKIFDLKPHADGVYGCNVEYFETERAKDLYFTKRSNELTSITKKISPEQLYRCLLFGGFGEFHTSTITLKKRVFQKVGLFNPNLRYGEDTELWLKLALSCKLYNGSIDKPQSVRIVHEKNSIHEWDKIIPYRDLMYQFVFDWVIKQPVAFNIKNDFFTALYYHFKGRYKSAVTLLWKQLYRNPSMIFSSFLYKKFLLLLKS